MAQTGGTNVHLVHGILPNHMHISRDTAFPTRLRVLSEDRSAWASAQADLSLQWAHMES